MRKSVPVLLAGVMALSGLAFVAQAAEPSAQDYLKEIQTAAAGPTQPSASPVTGVCENGEARDENGACPVVDEAGPQRGFTLFSGSMTKPQVAPSKPASQTAVAREVRPVAAASDSLRCGLLCDLKISFKTGSSVLTPDSEIKLSRFADALRDASLVRKRFEIAGHTDASGSADKNRALSQARAEAVKAFLVAHGVDTGRLQAKGYGAEGLAYPNAPTDPRNRRVEARVLN